MKKFAIIPIIITLVATACGHDTRLDTASGLMYEHPDSAMALLDSIDPTTLRCDADIARYALLYTQAQNKIHFDPSSDSLINIAVDYYDHAGHDSLRMLSHFYRAYIRNVIGSYHSALRDGLTAKDIAARDFNRTGYHLNAQYVSVDKAAAHNNRGHLHCIWPVYQSKQFV